MKRKEEDSSENAKWNKASQVSATELKAMVMRNLTELSEITENYQKVQGNYNELTANYINM